jgi:hydroxymethylglutaryl-CoA reductase
MVIAAVGLASNLAALRALATEGIQRGHMSLNARSVAVAAGATGALVDRVAAELAEGGDICAERAAEILARLQAS